MRSVISQKKQYTQEMRIIFVGTYILFVKYSIILLCLRKLKYRLWRRRIPNFEILNMSY